jgi:predicted transposase YdaD
LFKAAFETPSDAASLLRSVLSPDVVNAIAWDTLAAVRGSFVDPELAGRHTDLLFSANLVDQRVLIYVLLEHQSTSDPEMPLRVLVYLVRIWERFRKESANEGEPLPPIIPIVISHASGGWTAPRTFHEMFAPSVVALPSVAALLPSFAIVVEDLARYSNADLRRLALSCFPTLAVWALRDARDPQRLLANLEHWAHAFVEAQLSPRGLAAIEQLLRYFSYVLDDLDLEKFRDKLEALAPGTETTAMATLAERLLNQGREEGRCEARVEVLVKQLALRFGTVTAEQRATIDASSAEALDRYIERVLTAASIDAVLA